MREIGGQELDRDIAIEPRVARPIHLAHAAFADEWPQHIGPQAGSFTARARRLAREKGDAPPAAAVPANATVPPNRPGITRTALVEHPKACAFRSTMNTGSSRPAGAVPDYDQVIVALGDAEFSLTIDGTTTNRWKRGDVAFIGRNVTYEYTNPGKPANFVTVAIK